MGQDFSLSLLPWHRRLNLKCDDKTRRLLMGFFFEEILRRLIWCDFLEIFCEFRHFWELNLWKINQNFAKFKKNIKGLELTSWNFIHFPSNFNDFIENFVTETMFGKIPQLNDEHITTGCFLCFWMMSLSCFTYDVITHHLHLIKNNIFFFLLKNKWYCGRGV